MSELSYVKFDEDIARLAERVKAMEINTMICKFTGGKAISEIYLENIERPPSAKKRRYKGQRC